MLVKILIKLFLSIFLCFLCTIFAYAELRVCNNSQSLVGVAIGYKTQKGWQSKGWWRIAPKHCDSLIEGPLNSRFYYLHAEDAKNDGAWQGNISMCLSDGEFKIIGAQDCYVRGYQRAGFYEIDTGGQASWTIQLSDNSEKSTIDN